MARETLDLNQIVKKLFDFEYDTQKKNPLPTEKQMNCLLNEVKEIFKVFSLNFVQKFLSFVNF